MINQIPPWVLRLALLLSLPIAGAALFLTRTYAVGNLAVLELDADTVFVRQLSIDVLLAAHVVAFFLCALLPDSVFRFRRWQLYALAVAIWVFDAGAIYQARFGVMDSADQAQVSAVTRLADQRAAIRGLQESAAAMRVTAARQLANKMITASAQSQREAARLEAEATAMTRQLNAMPSGAGTTEVRTWGWAAPYKAATESALISFVSLIMLGLSGLMLRALLQPAATRRPAPAPIKRPAPPIAKEPVLRTLRTLRARLETGRAMADPDALEAAKVPPADSDAPAAPAPAPKPAAPAKVQDTPAQVQLAKSASASKPVPQGVRDAISSGATKPTLRGIKDDHNHGQEFASAWLEQLGAEGVLEPAGRGRWKLAKAKV